MAGPRRRCTVNTTHVPAGNANPCRCSTHPWPPQHAAGVAAKELLDSIALLWRPRWRPVESHIHLHHIRASGGPMDFSTQLDDLQQRATDTKTADQAIRTATLERGGRQWLRVFLVGLLLWVASVVVTFWTGNTNLVPTVILFGSFLVPVTFATYAFGRAAQVVTPQRILAAFVYGGVLGVLGASVLEAAFLTQPSVATYLGVGLIEEAVKLAALWLLA